jgi:hypothetical protein
MPTVEQFSKYPNSNRFILSFTHNVPKKSFFKPNQMYFREEKAVFYLSPFKIYLIDKMFGSGFPLAGNFNFIQMSEYEMV